MLEATMTGLPVVASGWSGQIDFLDSEKSILLTGEMQKVPGSAVWKDIVIPESQWFTVDEQIAYRALNYSFDNVYTIKNRAKSLMGINRDKFTLNNMAKKLGEIMDKYTKDLPSQVGLKLPKLKKV